jgi:hypothetical protein
METRDSYSWAIIFVAVLVCPGAAGEELPDLELLEFLSDWHDVDGKSLDPGMFDGDAQSEPKPTTVDSPRVPDAPQ